MEEMKEPASETERRRSKSGKRRSGFSRGRVSLTQLSKEASAADSDMAGGELYKQIPLDLPPAHRLSLLSRLVLRHTVEVLDREFEDKQGFDNFKAEAIEAVGATIDQMENDGSFEQACTAPSLVPNPVNMQMDVTICELESSIKRLQQEEADWDDLVRSLESQADTAQQQLSQLDMGHSDVPEEVKTLSQSFLPEPADTPDLQTLSTEVVRDVKTISLLMDDYCQSIRVLGMVHRAATKHMDAITRTLEHGTVHNGWDPKEAIRQLLAS